MACSSCSAVLQSFVPPSRKAAAIAGHSLKITLLPTVALNGPSDSSCPSPNFAVSFQRTSLYSPSHAARHDGRRVANQFPQSPLLDVCPATNCIASCAACRCDDPRRSIFDRARASRVPPARRPRTSKTRSDIRLERKVIQQSIREMRGSSEFSNRLAFPPSAQTAA